MRAFVLLIITAFSFVPARSFAEGMKLGDICRLKGQEINTLHGLGLVVGLRGTGDGDVAPTARALARYMQLLGAPMSIDTTGQLNLEDVADSKNVALVFVTAKIPAVGAQQGDPLDVTVSAINAKSLEGGYLMLTPLVGPRSDSPIVYAMAQGRLQVSADGTPTTAVIQGGAKMEANVRASFQQDGKITLILDRDFASFDIAQRIQSEISSFPGFTDVAADSAMRRRWVRAIDSLHVEVMIPPQYQENPIDLVYLLLGLPISMPHHHSRVVINEKDGIVVIGKDVEIAPVLITHRNMRIEAGGPGLLPVSDRADETENAKLKSLADALNALDVPTEDLIAIIKTLKAKGDLYGDIVFQ